MFERIIGYQAEKDELAIFCDTIRNMEYYKSLGIKVPKGIILYGEPGVGKTTFCNCIIEACGRPAYVLRKNAETGEFIKNMVNVFEEAKKNAPSVILLDDIDKFGNGEEYAQEYTALQGIMDAYANDDIFVLATANEYNKLPRSLVRPGRFDRSIKIGNPNKLESANITKYYMNGKNIDPTINMDNIAKMVSGSSCATLESVINMAAMIATYERSPIIRKEHLIEAILSVVYDMPRNSDDRTQDERYFAAIHEAGHAVVASFVLCDDFDLATIRRGRGGSIYSWIFSASDFKYDPNNILKAAMVGMSGKAATELRFGMVDPTSSIEVKCAIEMVDTLINDYGVDGIGSIRSINQITSGEEVSQSSKELSAQTVDNLYKCAKTILVNNWFLVEATAQLLLQRESILLDDIEDLKKNGTNLLGANFSNLIVG